jgi:UPF0176 protein
MGRGMGISVAAFYKFSSLPRYREAQAPLLAALKRLGVKGSVLVAEEGVNGTIAAAQGQMADALKAIADLTGVGTFHPKLSEASVMPFKRMKVRLKKEIVTIGDVYAKPQEVVGDYIDAADWNALISDPDVVVVDTRNAYEVQVGSFQGAVDPGTERFGEFPDFVRHALADQKHKKIAMFCTGGIRCEKATSFMKHEGFQHVYHLKGGILKYLEEVPADESLWTGGCFVFDERVAVGHGLQPTGHSICHGCLLPVSSEGRQSPQYEDGVCCEACAENLSPAQKASNRERQKQFILAAKRGKRHLGPVEP